MSVFHCLYVSCAVRLGTAVHVSVTLDHHQGARRSYPKVTTDHLLVRYTVVLRQHACVRC